MEEKLITFRATRKMESFKIVWNFFWNNKLLKFLVVGGVNTLFGYSLFAFFIFLKFHYTLAVLFGTMIGIIFNFKTTGRIVFKSSDNSLLFKFVGVYAVTYVINVACLKVCDLFKMNMYLAGAILILPVAVVSFMLQRRFVFTEGVK